MAAAVVRAVEPVRRTTFALVTFLLALAPALASMALLGLAQYRAARPAP